MKVIIFDLDGTLLDTLEDLHICFNHALEKFGYSKRTKAEIQSFVGNGIKKAIEKALPNKIEEAELNKIVNFFKSYYPQHMTDNTKPYDGIIDLLKQLQQKGYKTGVVSNKYDEAVKRLCKIYFGDLILSAVGESSEVQKKPSGDGLLKVIKELEADITKDYIVYAGDSEVDLQTAANVRIPCISVLWGFKNKDFLAKNGGKFFAETPKDVIKIIEKKIYLE